MQDNVGIVRNEAEMSHALEQLEKLWERAGHVGVTGNREFNPGWHTALDLKNLLTVSEAITRAAIERKESRGAQFRDDYPDKERAFAKVNTMISQGERRHDASPARTVAGNAGLFEAGDRGNEMILSDSNRGLGSARDPEISRMNVLQNLARRCERRRISRLHDRSRRRHGRARCGARHPGDAGERSCLPMELQSRQMRLVFGGSQRDAEADVHDADERSAAG